MKNLKVWRYDYDKKKLDGNVVNDIKTEQKFSELFLKISTLKLLQTSQQNTRCGSSFSKMPD